ncbi:MAG: GNAT family N-acetyltransferase [Ardenticatenia bacterium]|nr:GNAT family N-acetyltransferase [Ardenticatenia bacterium]
MEVRFREGRPEDVPTLLRRVAETAWHDLPAEAKAIYTREEVARHAQETATLLRRRGESRLVVAETPGGENVGHVWLGVVRDSYTGAKRGYIYDLYVEPAWRGRGVGRALLAEAERHSRELGCVELGLTVAATNVPARRLYEAAGFGVERLLMGKRL